MRRTYSALYLGIGIYTTVAQTYSLLTVASHTELRCSSDRYAGPTRPAIIG